MCQHSGKPEHSPQQQSAVVASCSLPQLLDFALQIRIVPVKEKPSGIAPSRHPACRPEQMGGQISVPECSLGGFAPHRGIKLSFNYLCAPREHPRALPFGASKAFLNNGVRCGEEEPRRERPSRGNQLYGGGMQLPYLRRRDDELGRRSRHVPP